jgi:hypothetical protein
MCPLRCVVLTSALLAARAVTLYVLMLYMVAVLCVSIGKMVSASPALVTKDELKGMPPTAVWTAEIDVLRDEGTTVLLLYYYCTYSLLQTAYIGISMYYFIHNHCCNCYISTSVYVLACKLHYASNPALQVLHIRLVFDVTRQLCLNVCVHCCTNASNFVAMQ